MSVDPKNETTKVEDANRGDIDLSRRRFLLCLTILGVSGATAVTLGVNAADAATESEVASRPKARANEESSTEGKKVELVQQVDANDPLQAFNQPYYRHRRRVVRRTLRRERRVVRRVGRRVRRRIY